MTTDKQELQRLCDAATPGPWEPNEYGVGEFWVSSAQYDEAGEDVSVAVCILDSDIRYRTADMDQQQADMKFIAAARTAVPELLAELAAVTTERDEMYNILSDLKEWDYASIAGFSPIPLYLRRRMQEVLAACEATVVTDT